MRIRLALVALLTLAVAGAACAEPPALAPFEVDWRQPADSPVGMAGLLSAPAGKNGPVVVKDGHFATGGKRIRFWGVNVSGRACLPPQDDAPRIAAHLARCGINAVRFHFFDQRAPGGIIDATRNDTRALDPAQLDRLDRFVFELKKCGIYTDLNLNVARQYKPGDGVRDAELLGFAKALTHFDPRLIELQKEYARALLTHKNPYTGNEYRNEPAVALVELLNENSLIESWFSGRLLGTATRKNPGTWTDIPASYAQDLTDRYNAYLREQLSLDALAALRKEAGVAEGAAVPRLAPKEFAKASPTRFRTEAEFYFSVEKRYHDDMAKFLRQDVGVRQPIVGSSDHNHGKTGYPLLAATAGLDVVDGHVYWQHPNYITDPATGRTTGFEIPNTPMVADPLHSTPVQLSRSAVAGKPYIVSEVNHPFPNEWAAEGVPILAAYAALEDWDGLFWYTLAHEDILAEKPRMMGHFDFVPEPIKMTQVAAGALVFLRGDVQAARKTVTRTYSHEQVLDGLRLGWKDAPYFTPGFPPALPLVHGSRIASLGGPPTAAFEPVGDGSPIRSDTGELAWYTAPEKKGLVTVKTPRTESLVGFIKDARPDLAHLAVAVEPEFCAITLSALDEKPIAAAERLLLTAGARAAYVDMKWNAKRTSLEFWGQKPMSIAPVTGAVTLRGLTGAKSIEAQPLDAVGRPLGAAISAQKSGDGWLLAIGNPATTWYLVRVTR
jgi:hypothetical protein